MQRSCLKILSSVWYSVRWVGHLVVVQCHHHGHGADWLCAVLPFVLLERLLALGGELSVGLLSEGCRGRGIVRGMRCRRGGHGGARGIGRARWRHVDGLLVRSVRVTGFRVPRASPTQSE